MYDRKEDKLSVSLADLNARLSTTKAMLELVALLNVSRDKWDDFYYNIENPTHLTILTDSAGSLFLLERVKMLLRKIRVNSTSVNRFIEGFGVVRNKVQMTVDYEEDSGAQSSQD